MPDFAGVRLNAVITSVDLFTDDREGGLRRIEWIGFPRKPMEDT